MVVSGLSKTMYTTILFAKCFFVCIGMSAASLVLKVNSTTPRLPAVAGKEEIPAQARILNDMSWKLRMAFIKNYTTAATDKPNCEKYPFACELENQQSRRVGVQELKLPARRQDSKTDAETDDNNMKMKLFRLMYETVRDSDLKVKRAELIKKSYTKSPRFEIGYLFGDITDKFNTMTDINLTLQRLYNEWKPIEHINAYEQIANLAINVGHIVDMVNGVEKKSKKEEASKQSRKTVTKAAVDAVGGGPPATRQTNVPAYFQINGLK